MTTEGSDLGKQCSGPLVLPAATGQMKVAVLQARCPKAGSRLERQPAGQGSPGPVLHPMLSHCWSLLPNRAPNPRLRAPLSSVRSTRAWPVALGPDSESSGFTAYHFFPEPWVRALASSAGFTLGCRPAQLPGDPGAATSSCGMGEPLCPSHLLSAVAPPSWGTGREDTHPRGRVSTGNRTQLGARA